MFFKISVLKKFLEVNNFPKNDFAKELEQNIMKQSFLVKKINTVFETQTNTVDLK